MILSENSADKAMLLDYKATYEHIRNKKHKKDLLYETQAVKSCDKIIAVNLNLVANIYGNIGGLYHSENQLEKAKYYMELAYNTLVKNSLDYTNDNII